MGKPKFSASQIGSTLKEAHGGISVAEILRTYGISGTKFYKWRSKYGGLETSELKRIKELEH
jgi:putative transposase